MKDRWFVANFLDEILFSYAKLEVIILGKRTNHLGETNVNTKGTMMKSINHRSNEDIDIEFLDDHHFIKNTKHILILKAVRSKIHTIRLWAVLVILE